MNQKVIGFSLLCASMLYASDATLAPLTVESTTLNDVSGEEVKSADLAEALSKQVPSINLIRRSGIANDILLRGQKRDNISVTIDGTKIHGACPNRMDPPTSHVVTHNIEGVEIIEGPYNVEDFGVLSGDVKVTTKEPSKEVGGMMNVNVGSYGYRKVGLTVEGGNDRVQVMVVGSTEQSDQYEDGDGNSMAEQVTNTLDAANNNNYQAQYYDMEAYEKKSLMAKVNVNLTDNQQLKLSYTNNQSDDVLYPSSGMDALYDDSLIYNVKYVAKNLGGYSKQLNVQAYQSEVDHPMSTIYRLKAAMHEMTNHLTTKTKGLKLKNHFEAMGTGITVGLDASDRNWDGSYYMDGVWQAYSINDADTKNRALFMELERQYNAFNVKIGARYDDTTIESGNAGFNDNDYDSLSANLYATYSVNPSTKVFGGFGQSHRVPDARELYFQGYMGGMNPRIGTDGLNETTNNEIDLGIEHKYSNASVKLTTFYSKLDDYIYHASNAGTAQFANIDATIYGAELSGGFYPMDALSIDYGITYLKGEKDELPAGHTDKDLADITPLKGNLAVSYNYLEDSYARVELVAADRWDSYDSDVSEQEIEGYGIVNLKVSHDFTNRFNLTAGIDNVFDKTYAVSNTYDDLKLLGLVGSTTMLLNEPGRYVYFNATYKF